MQHEWISHKRTHNCGNTQVCVCPLKFFVQNAEKKNDVIAFLGDEISYKCCLSYKRYCFAQAYHWREEDHRKAFCAVKVIGCLCFLIQPAWQCRDIYTLDHYVHIIAKTEQHFQLDSFKAVILVARESCLDKSDSTTIYHSCMSVSLAEALYLLQFAWCMLNCWAEERMWKRINAISILWFSNISDWFVILYQLCTSI